MHIIPNFERRLLRLLTLISLVAILGSALFYFFPVTIAGMIIVVALSIVGAWFIPLADALTKKVSDRTVAEIDMPTIILIVLGIFGLLGWWAAILPLSITDAVRTPWSIVPIGTILALFPAFLVSLRLLSLGRTTAGAILLGATIFSAVSLAAVVYPLGFGFDPFLHRATVSHIAEHGTIVPKPLYYIGQYAIELAFVLLTPLSLLSLDKFLLPLLGTIIIISSLAYGLQSRRVLPLRTPSVLGQGLRAVGGPAPRHPLIPFIGLGALLFFPLSILTTTTPQGLGFVFAFAAIALSMPLLHGDRPPLNVIWLLALASVITHPIAGIPMIIWCLLLKIFERQETRGKRQVWLAVIGGLAATSALPILFLLQAARSGLDIHLSLGNFFDGARWQALALNGFIGNHFSTVFDGLYLIIDNILWIVVILAIIGVVQFWKTQYRSMTMLFIIFAGAMFVNFLILSILFDFGFLISYEQTDYALRALTAMTLFLLPLAALGLTTIWQRLAHLPSLRLTFIVLLAAIATAQVYGIYPRHDNYARSAGFNVSTSDFKAVEAIQAQAQGANYIVLSNQQTAAAAVATYSFAHYYPGDIFYYPIPTGGPLYAAYLSMVNDGPSRATIDAALELTGAQRAYFVVSDYWWNAPAIIENAKAIADKWAPVDGGKITIFVFEKTP